MLLLKLFYKILYLFWTYSMIENYTICKEYSAPLWIPTYFPIHTPQLVAQGALWVIHVVQAILVVQFPQFYKSQLLTCCDVVTDFFHSLPRVPLLVGHSQSRPLHVASDGQVKTHDVRYHLQSSRYLSLPLSRHIPCRLLVPVQLGKVGKLIVLIISK